MSTLPKDEWVLEFVYALMFDLRPDIGKKFAYLVANNEWATHKHLAPEQAARQWAERVKSAR